jgi:hypothetical protein
MEHLVLLVGAFLAGLVDAPDPVPPRFAPAGVVCLAWTPATIVLGVPTAGGEKARIDVTIELCTAWALPGRPV